MYRGRYLKGDISRATCRKRSVEIETSRASRLDQTIVRRKSHFATPCRQPPSSPTLQPVFLSISALQLSSSLRAIRRGRVASTKELFDRPLFSTFVPSFYIDSDHSSSFTYISSTSSPLDETVGIDVSTRGSFKGYFLGTSTFLFSSTTLTFYTYLPRLPFTLFFYTSQPSTSIH
jgi:hypothetical protein